MSRPTEHQLLVLDSLNSGEVKIVTAHARLNGLSTSISDCPGTMDSSAIMFFPDSIYRDQRQQATDLGGVWHCISGLWNPRIIDRICRVAHLLGPDENSATSALGWVLQKDNPRHVEALCSMT